MTDTVRIPVRRNTVFVIIAMALLMMSIDATIVATALHAIQQGLDTSINLAGWTLTAYAFGFVLMLPVSGKLAERFGRRRVFMGSLLAFTLASLGCGMADNIYVLIVLRTLQAVMICSLIAVMVLRRTGYRLPLYVGSAATIIGLVLLALSPMAGMSPYAWLAFAAFLVGAGNGTINPAMRNAGLQLAPESSSMLAALRTLSLQIGSIVTISVVAAGPTGAYLPTL